MLDMGEPIKITYLAEQMIHLAGFTPHQDIEICYTGLRPGEKLFEELFHDAEPLAPTSHEKILQASSRIGEPLDLERLHAELSQACQADSDCLMALLKRLVPEYVSAPSTRQCNFDKI